MDSRTQNSVASILIVDDYVVTQRVLSTQLRKGGYEVTTAGSGQEALSYLIQRQFDLAIIDVAMPEMDGITLLQKLRQEHTALRLPVIMLTASVLDEDRIRAQAAGATDFLTKPISSWELLDVVNRQLTLAQEKARTNSYHL
ncbi:MAG: response regulator [Caldilineaceae bacterium]